MNGGGSRRLVPVPGLGYVRGMCCKQKKNDAGRDARAESTDISRHEAAFEAFAGRYLREHPEAMLCLKREHTHNVLQHARTLVAEAPLSSEERRAALLAALYHDTGRFPQYVKWRTFSDAHSENHGLLGVRTVRQEGFLADEPAYLQKWVLTAIALHNRYSVPALSEPYASITHVVRDADKLDIMRIMAQHLSKPVPTEDVVLHVQDEPEAWSPEIAETVLAGKTPGYTEIRYVNDFRMLLGAWIHDLHFAASRRICAHAGFIQVILEGLPRVAELDAVRAYILGELAKAGACV